MTKVIENILDWKKELNTLDQDRLKIGFVPTMGALHSGHTSLFARSHQEMDITVVSIFVNPTQFNNTDDLKNYPKTIESDIKKLNESKVDYLFMPNFQNIYPDNYRFQVNEIEFSKNLCGQYRQGHFSGVLTVVLKLFNIIKPYRAYFGEKDFQQFSLIRDMAKAFFLDVEVVSCPTLRDENGLALSSRNVRLTEKGKVLANKFANILQEKNSLEDTLVHLVKNKIDVEYVQDFDGRRFAAVNIDGVRLIDNVKI